jgi:hypothetical protein
MGRIIGLCPVFFLCVLIYVIYNTLKRGVALSWVQIKLITGYTLVALCFSVNYLYNIHSFNGTWNFGSDSRLFSEIISDIVQRDFSNPLLVTIFFDNKFIHALLLSGLGVLVGLDYLDFFVYTFNIILQVAIFVNILSISSNDSQGTMRKLLSGILIVFGNLLTFIVVISWFRDTLIMYCISETLFVLYKNKVSVKRFFQLLILAINLFFLRAFFVIPFLLRPLMKKKEFIKYFLLVFVTLLVTVVFFQPVLLTPLVSLEGEVEMYEGGIGGNLIITPAELSVSSFNFQLVGKIFSRFIIGFMKFVIAPLFSQTLYGFDRSIKVHGTEFYQGFDFQLIIICNSLIHNFLLVPFFFGSVCQIVKDKLRKRQKMNYFLITMILIIIMFYGLKFIGARNFRIDYIVNFLFIIIIVTNKFVLNKIVVLFFILFTTLNVFYFLLG